MSVQSEIDSPFPTAFRRAYIKRRQSSDGKLESSWREITSYVKSWGNLNASGDSVRTNRFTHAGCNLKVINDDGSFNKETEGNSLWNGFLTRYRTLLKIEAGYEDTDGSDLPTDPTQGIYLLDKEIVTSGETLESQLKGSSLKSLFDEVQADEVVGLGATASAGAIIALIRDHTDGSNNFVFRGFITSTLWTIQTGSSINYNLATATSLDGKSCWDLMQGLAEAEGNILLVNRLGGIEFRDRDPKTTTVQLQIKGLSNPRVNLGKFLSFKEDRNRYFNFIRYKWQSGDTSTSYVEAGTISAVDPSNTAWINGNRKLEVENTFVATQTTAQTIANNLFNIHSVLKEEIQIEMPLAVNVDVSDRVSFTHKTFTVENNTLWDNFNWDRANWSKAEGETFNWAAKEFKVLSHDRDIDNFKSKMVLREV